MRRLLPICLVASLLTAGPALAGNVQVGLGLRAGSLSLQAPTAAALAGKSVQVPLTVADARGSGAGWTLELDVASPVTITGISARCAAGSTCTLPHVISGAGILHAAADSGMGAIQLVVTVAPLRAGSASVPLAFRVG